MTPVASPASIGRFEVIGRLGQGAQSVVYLGYDPQLHREVALKAVHLAQNDSSRAALLREARAVSRLSHPGIVPVFEALETEDGSCLVFEYVAGHTLAERIDGNGALTPQQALELLLPVLDAVAFAHSHRIIHRDLKPSNILLDDAGRPRVMDFGIAVRHELDVDDDDGETQSAMLGTPAYMAPEYASAGRVSPAMDIFAAGLILYELLCGQRAVGQRDGVQAIRFLLQQDLRLPDAIAAQCGETLCAVLHRSLARDPAQRQASMSQLAEELREYLNPVLKPHSAVVEMARAAALDALLAQLPAELDFPLRAQSEQALREMQETSGSDLPALIELAMADVALLLGLVRRANSAEAQLMVATTASSASAALAVLGFESSSKALHWGHAAGSDGPLAGGASVELADEMAAALLCGLLSREFSGLLEQEGEEAQLAGVLQRLGRMILVAGFPERAQKVLSVEMLGHWRQEARAREELGVGLEDLAQALLRQWNLTEVMLHCVHACRPAELRAMPTARRELLRAASSLASEVTDALLHPDPTQDLLGAAARRYEACLLLSEQELTAAIALVAHQIRNLARPDAEDAARLRPLSRLLQRIATGTAVAL